MWVPYYSRSLFTNHLFHIFKSHNMGLYSFISQFTYFHLYMYFTLHVHLCTLYTLLMCTLCGTKSLFPFLISFKHPMYHNMVIYHFSHVMYHFITYFKFWHMMCHNVVIYWFRRLICQLANISQILAPYVPSHTCILG